MKGFINNIQKYSIHDGGGIRTNVFFQGCPLHCKWCSNPETQSFFNERIYWKNKCIGCGTCVNVCPFKIGCTDLSSEKCLKCGTCIEKCYAGALKWVAYEIESDALVDELLKDTVFYRTSNGGVTLTGGEVLSQWKFAAEVLSALKELYIDTAIETSGYAPYENLKEVSAYCDRVLFDVKHTDSDIHKKYTGVPNSQILSNLSKLSKTGVEIIIRVPLIHNVNDDIANIDRTGNIALDLGIKEIDLLPFHRMGESKYVAMQRPIEMPDSTVPEEHVEFLKNRLNQRGIKVVVGG